MDGNEQVGQVLAADATLAGLTGGRIWNTSRKEDETIPSLVFNRVTSEYIDHSKGSGGTVFIRYQLDSYAATLTEAVNIGVAAVAALVREMQASQGSRQDFFDFQENVWRTSTDALVGLQE